MLAQWLMENEGVNLNTAKACGAVDPAALRPLREYGEGTEV